jgi:hypothetical protein
MKATIVNTVENTTKVVELTDAINDLAGLKHFLNISDGQFFEGSTHTDLTSDTQELPVLPDNKKERGYVFFVSPAQSKIKNGAYSRKECYAIIKDNNLGEAVKSKFGRNFTQVSTDALNGFIADNQTAVLSNSSAPAKATSKETVAASENTESADTIDTEKELFYYIEKALSAVFVQAGMSDSTVKLMSDTIHEGIEKVFPNPYSVQDIANMQK